MKHLLAALVVLASVLHAQAPGGSGVIIGRVLDIDSGEPVPGAKVGINASSAARTLTGGSASDTVLTDSQGRFYFSELRPGTYAVTPAPIQGVPLVIPAPSRHLSITANHTISNVEVFVIRPAWISGRVSDESGQPVAGMSVWAYRRMGTGSQATFTGAAAATTNDLGDYTIDPLPPGDYLICACQWMAPLLDTGLSQTLRQLQPSRTAHTVPVEVDSHWRPPGRTFHPAAAHPANATIITLRSHDARPDVHIGVALGRLATISGRVVGLPDAMAASAIRLRPVVPAGGPIVSALEPDSVGTGGEFRFVNVPTGNYTLQVRYRGPGAPGRTSLGLAERLGLRTAPPIRQGAVPLEQNDILVWSESPIVVDGRDERDLQVPVAPAIRVPGRVLLSENGTLQTFRANGGRLERLDEPAGDPPVTSSVRADDDGAFELEGVIPGRYRFRWTILPPGLTLRSITYGGRDVTDLPFLIEDGRPLAFEVTLVPHDLGTVPGRIVSEPTVPQADAVVVFPADRRLWEEPTVAERRFAVARPTQLGYFQFEDLPRGDYVMAAISARELVMLTWQTSSRLETLASTGRRVTIVAGDNPLLEIRR